LAKGGATRYLQVKCALEEPAQHQDAEMPANPMRVQAG
jgi:hypothetical protein